MKNTILSLILVPLFAIAGVTVDTVRFGSMKPSQYVVTNVTHTIDAEDLAPAIDYTTAVSNRFDTAIGSLNSATNDLTAKVEAKFDQKGEDGAQVYWDENVFYVYASANIDGNLYLSKNWSSISSDDAQETLPQYISGNSVTNGGAVAAAQAMTNDSGIVRGELSENELEWYMSKTITASSGCGFGALDGWDSYWAGGGYETLPDYLASLVWHPSSATLAQYGITDAYTKAQTETASTNAATSVVSNHLDYALGAFSATLSSGEIRSITPSSSTEIPVTLNFGSDATKSADALLYVDASSLTDNVDLSLSGYTFIGDEGYQTATKGKKVLFMFTRINATTVIANKREY